MKIIFLILLVFFFVGCSENKEEERLFEVLEPGDSGIDFTNQLTETNALNILDYLYFYNGGGVAVGDIDNDGLPDIYFTGNQVKNNLYLNKGNMKFEDITKNAGVEGESDWNTGVVMADVNGDGFLDIYVCAVVGINGLQGQNELFINNGDNTFTESAADYGLDVKNYSSSAAFFDYDNDGDLDMYLLNHAVHTVNTYGPADIRNNRVAESGDKLFKNENGKFVDISEKAGIYGGANGYGLGIATADFNNDGFTDIYVSNDFHEDDYYYINNGTGTFSEVLKDKFGHISRFSMGSDVADINQDGFMDILSLDMLPENEKVLKASVGDDPLDLHTMKIDRLNYHHQYTRNMLHINRRGEYFQEVGLMSNLAASDWSWSALFADFDLDGIQDVFISTGIPKRPNDLDYIKYVSSSQIRNKINTTKLVDQKALEMMPSGHVPNYIFKGKKNLNFQDLSDQWIAPDTVISTGTAYADLNNDGALELITNNINRPAGIYQNNKRKNANFLKLSFENSGANTFGIGTKVLSYHNEIMQVKQLYPSRGFQSSSEPVIHFGYGNAEKIDSLLIIWPDQSLQKKTNVATNQHLKISPEEERTPVDYKKLFPQPEKWFEKIDSLPGLTFRHEEGRYIDFDRQKLIPYKISDRGPAMVMADFNSDGKDDVFFGNSKFKPAQMFFQEDERFKAVEIPEIQNDSITEDVSAIAEDFDQDGLKDLLVVSGGGEFFSGNKALTDRLYLNRKENFNKKKLPGKPENSGVVRSHDFNKNGFPDIFIGHGGVPNDFGQIKDSYLLTNENGTLKIDQKEIFKKVGMITDAVWSDFDNDGWTDLIVVGEWMRPKFFKNKHGRLEEVTRTFLEQDITGLWQSIIPFDINKDGKTDYLLGNWGLNTKFKASENYPLKMFYSDFDQNGSTETILAYQKKGNYYPVNGLDELVGQLSYLRKKFPSYNKFAGKNMEEIFDRETLKQTEVREVTTLASGYLLNRNGKFIFKSFEPPLQVAPLMRFLKADLNGNGEEEVLAAGNYFGVTPYHGRFDAFAGVVIQKGGTIQEASEIGLDLSQKSVRGMEIIKFRGQKYLLVNFNNDSPAFYKLND